MKRRLRQRKSGSGGWFPRAGGALAIAAALAMTALAGQPASRPATGPTSAAAERSARSPEEQLWASIGELRQPSAATQPYERWFAAEQQRHVALLERLRLYQTLYPGGGHRDEAIELELTALFELGTLRGGALGPLCERVAVLLADPPSRPVAEEAAYWDLLCHRPAASSQAMAGSQAAASTEPAASSQPTSTQAAEPGALDAGVAAAYRQYLARHPRSRHAPRLATLLFEDAARRGDRSAMAAALAHVAANFPDHAATRALQGAWRRVEAVGRPFVLTFTTADKQAVDARALAGRPIVVVVWAEYDAESCRRVVAVEEVRRANPDLAVLGVNLDETAKQGAEAARKLGLEWPQFNDGLGWGNEFVRTWGVRRLPLVFVVDRAGRLMGSSEGDEWRAWAEEALRLP